VILKPLFRWFLAAFLIVAGVNHFRMASAYTAMVPLWLPSPSNLGAVAGICEILGGIGILIPGLRRAAGWGLVALLVAVLPANVHAAFSGHMVGFDFPTAVLWIRLPLQVVLIAWASWVAIAREPRLGI
jgi:uncharacterized membrane protein